jgi:hypothetical protein
LRHHDKPHRPRGAKRLDQDRAVPSPARKPAPRPSVPAPPGAGSVRESAPNLPGSAEWLAAHGIHPKVWAARGVWRYTTDDNKRVKDEYQGLLKKTRLGSVTKAVRQSGGLVMRKHAPPGFEPIPSQLRPDKPIIMDGRTTWHYHDAEGGDRPVFPEEAGKAAGKKLPKLRVLTGLERDQHVDRAKSAEPYDPETGIGDHHGVNVDFVHPHAPEAAKYVLFGNKKKGDPADNTRIDVHPWALKLLPESRRVFFVLEGTLKNDAVLSTGEAVFSVPSVTLWDPRELRRFAQQFLQDKIVFIVPDADWYLNPAVDRQALLVRSVIRREGISAHIAAPPIEGLKDGIKGVDDFLGFGEGAIAGLIVRGREAPIDRIMDFALRSTSRRRRRTRFALEGLSLHAGSNGRFDVPMGTLARFMGTRKPSVVEVIEDLAGAVDVEGSLETKIEEWREAKVMDWVERPSIIIKPEFPGRRQRRPGAPRVLGRGLK